LAETIPLMPRTARIRHGVRLAHLAICLELLVSSNLLTLAGIPYVTDGGAIFFKFHPGTLCLALAACGTVAGAGRSRPIDARLAAFFASCGFCILFVLLLTGPSNMIVLLDTFLPAGLLALVLDRAPLRERTMLRHIMQAVLALNALLALAETASQSTLVPLYLNDAAYTPHAEDFRPTALFDHPLTGALMMMIALPLAPSGRWRLPYQALIWLALIAFGGRMAMAMCVAAALAQTSLSNARLLLLRDAQALRGLCLAVIAAAGGAILLAAAASAGLGERLAGHLYWDNSAQVRLAQWQILGQLEPSQLLFGIPRPQLLARLNVLRLQSGVEVIENFWLLMFTTTGLLGFPAFLTTLGTLCAWCWRQSGGQGRWLLCSVLVVASSSNSLGRKSTVLVCLVAAIACIRRDAERRPVPLVHLTQGLPA